MTPSLLLASLVVLEHVFLDPTELVWMVVHLILFLSKVLNSNLRNREKCIHQRVVPLVNPTLLELD